MLNGNIWTFFKNLLIWSNGTLEKELQRQYKLFLCALASASPNVPFYRTLVYLYKIVINIGTILLN